MENTAQVEQPKYTDIHRIDANIMERFWDNVDKNLLEKFLEIKNSQ